MISTYKIGSLWLVILVALAACKSPQGTTASSSGGGNNAKQESKLSENERMELTFTYVNATKEKMLGNLDRASELFAQCIRIDGRNHAAMYELAGILSTQNKLNDASFFARSAVNLNPDNEWYQLMLAEILRKAKRFDDAAAVYGRLSKKYPDRIDFLFEHANTLVAAGKTTEALKVFDKIESQLGVSPELSIQKEQMWLKMNRTDKAIEELEKLIAAFPTEAQYMGMLADLYQSNKMPDKAMELYKRIEAIDPGNPFVNLSLADYYRGKGEKEKSFAELKKAFSSPKLELETKINILSSYYTIVQQHPEMMGQALELAAELARVHTESSSAHAIYGDFLSAAEKPQEAKAQYSEALKIDKTKFLIWQQLLLIDSELSDFDTMLSRSEEASTLFPSQPLIFYFNGVAHYQKKNYNKAIDAYKTALMLVVDNKNLQIQLHANIGDTYNQMKKYADSDAAYDEALALDPNNALVLNNYSYYLSVRGEKLDKAEKMSKLSNSLEPANSSYEDTYAWILYKNGNYADARTWLEKAMKNGGDKSAVILEHYGDVLFKLGEKEKALEYWKRAQAAGEGSEFLAKKLAEKIMYE